MATETSSNNDVPQLAFDLELYGSSSEIVNTQACRVIFTIRRLEGSQDQPCAISWNAWHEIFYAGSLKLLRHTDRGNEKVDVGSPESIPSDPLEGFSRPLKVNPNTRRDYKLYEIPPKGSLTLRYSLPESYHRCLHPGQTFSLQWTGGHIKHWAWGSTSNGKRIEFQNTSTSLHLPATEGIKFTVTEAQPWPQRAEVEAKYGFTSANEAEWLWRREQARHGSGDDEKQEEKTTDPDLPTLTASLEAAPTFTMSKPYMVTLRVKYEETPQRLGPIMYHNYQASDRFLVSKKEEKEGRDVWELQVSDVSTGFILVDDPDVRVKVAEHEDFVSLKPGETWSREFAIHHPSGGEIPSRSVPWDEFRIDWSGMNLDWWDWGTVEEHRETEAVLPCFIHAGVQDATRGMGNRKLSVRRAKAIYATVVPT
ncbi:kinesin light [Paramyrothecium foliicola]|nr:kinesin light [Paramyrothecium foliicola]